MPKRRTELDAQRAFEQRRAAAWLRGHARDIPEELSRHGIDGQVMVEGSRAERVRRLDPVEGVDELGFPVYDERNKRVPLVGLVQNVDVKEAELAARVRHVLTFLTEQQQDMLLGYYVEGRTLKELSRDGERKQSVHERLAWARNAFLKAWVKHAEDELTLQEEDF